MNFTNNNQNAQVNREPWNECHNFSLRCHLVKDNRNGSVTLKCFFATKKRDDGTYPASTWVDVYTDDSTFFGRTFKDIEDLRSAYHGKAVQVDGRIKADSWTDKSGIEHPMLTIFASKVTLREFNK